MLRYAFRIKKPLTTVRVPDEVLKSIGFVARVCGDGGFSATDLDFVGTAFIVSVPAKTLRHYRFSYVVTARHVVDNVPPNTKIMVAVNQAGGGIRSLVFQFASWFYHPDEAVDVAVMPYVWQPSDDISTFGLEDAFDEQNRQHIGVGDEVFFPGLFVHTPGSASRITPIVRHGHLALLPDEEIQVKDNFSRSYLIEARSIGGISGSPCFVRETIAQRTTTDDGRNTFIKGLGEMKLLGLMQGHWDIDESEKNEPHIIHSKHGVNLGLAVVVPVSRVLEVINQTQLSALRDSIEDQKRQDISPKLD